MRYWRCDLWRCSYWSSNGGWSWSGCCRSARCAKRIPQFRAQLPGGIHGAIDAVQVDGNIHSDGDTVAGSISLQKHKHGGVMGGNSTTGAPQ
ncbi:MAG: hypothetical protein ACK4V8_07655 [Moraxella osloensis]